MQMGNEQTDATVEDMSDADGILNIAFGFWRSALLLSADELGLFEALARGAADAPALGKRLGIGAEAAGDLLDALTQIGLVERRGDDFHNTSIAAHHLDPSVPGYLGHSLDMARATMREADDLTRRLRLSGMAAVEETQPTERMWADIAAILEANHAER